MSDQYYYGYGSERNGPVSAPELRALVESGRIQPGDTIWKEGIAEGIMAARVKNLFPPASADGLPEPVEPAAPERSSPELLSVDNLVQPAAAPAEPAKAEKPPVRPPAAPIRKGRAIGAKGAIILGQDGVSVRYRKKCIKCGYEENSTNRMPIRNGTTRVTFFCRQCRKLQPVEIQGTI
jgi:GYF domain 2